MLLLSGCGTSQQDRALSGAAIGGGAGVLGGALLGMPAVGGAVGAAAGVGIGLAIPSKEATTTASPLAPEQNDHAVTNYVSRSRDLAHARSQNFRAAAATCGGAVVMIDEIGGADANGGWLRLVYGCLAKDVAHAGTPRSSPAP
jgi:hypothetical protein